MYQSDRLEKAALAKANCADFATDIRSRNRKLRIFLFPKRGPQKTRRVPKRTP